MSKILFFRDVKTGFISRTPAANVPFIYDAEGSLLERWPAEWTNVPSPETTLGVFQPSPDFSHMAFSSNTFDWDPAGHGLNTAPGSAYDYDTMTHSITLISKTAAGTDIPQEPSPNLNAAEYIRFPGDVELSPSVSAPEILHPSISTDGSHILMSTRSGPNEPIPHGCIWRLMDLIHYDVSLGHDVNYVGMSSDGSKVFFTSYEDLTSDNSDTDTSLDLYMWSENSGAPTVTDIVRGGGAGNSDNCLTTWTSNCDIGTVYGSGAATALSTNGLTFIPGGQSDWPVASAAGDIYFYSPELLDGPANGVENSQNLYLYRNGSVHFVATLGDGGAAISKINVAPDGLHMAFITKARLTSYDNAGKSEMYSFDIVRDEDLLRLMPAQWRTPDGKRVGQRSRVVHVKRRTYVLHYHRRLGR